MLGVLWKSCYTPWNSEENFKWFVLNVNKPVKSNVETTVGRIILCVAHAAKTPLSSYAVKVSAIQAIFLFKILGA